MGLSRRQERVSEVGEPEWAASVGNRGSAVVRRSERRRSFLRERRRTRQIQSRDARAAGSDKMSVGPSKYELQGPTV
jgi:hypothetical protein